MNSAASEKIPSNFSGQSSDQFWCMARAIFGLQFRWINELFAPTPAFVSAVKDLENFISETDNDELEKEDLFLSGQTLNGLLVASSFLRLLESSRRQYKRTLKKTIAFIDLSLSRIQSNAGFADWVFLHGTIWNCWFMMNGRKHSSRNLRPEVLLESIRADNVSHLVSGKTADVFKKLIIANPLSVFLVPQLLCDYAMVKDENLSTETKSGETETKILLDVSEDQKVGIDCVFENCLSPHNLFWLANYMFSGLMSDPRFLGKNSCFGNLAFGCTNTVFENRIRFIGKFLFALTKKYNQPAMKPENRNRWRLFCIFFYKFVLTEWGDKKSRNLYSFFENDSYKMPESVNLSYFTILKNNGARLLGLKKDLGARKGFEKIAKAYADDHRMRFSGGHYGWVARGEMSSWFEGAFFLPSLVNQVYVLDIKDKYCIYTIRETKEVSEPSFFDFLLERHYSGESTLFTEDFVHFFAPLKQIVTGETVASKPIERERRELKSLYGYADFYIRMLTQSINRHLVSEIDGE